MVSIRLHPGADQNKCRDPQPNIRLSSCGGDAGRIKEPGGDRNSTRRAIESTNPYHWGFPETKPPTKVHIRTGPIPLSYTYM